MSLLDIMRQIDSLPTHCDQDGFPLVKVGEELFCSVEYADGLIGGQKVLGVAMGERFIELLMANGYQIPLTCPCCGGELHLRDMQIQELRGLLIGRTLEGFRHGEWVGKGIPPDRHPMFALQFSGQEDRKERTIEVSLESVRLIGKPKVAADPQA